MSCVRVIVRVRPPGLAETATNVTVFDNGCEVICKEEAIRFTFDAVFSPLSVQQDIFSNSVEQIVDQFLNEGYNGTIFAYGQTGSGKTHTMFAVPPEDPGVAFRVFRKIFSAGPGSFRVSFMEIYNEEFRDLVAKKSTVKLDLQSLPDGRIFVKNLTEKVVFSAEEMQAVLAQGMKTRSVAATLMNSVSSRAHSVFTILKADNRKLHLVDLAGSERQTKSGASGNTLKEAAKINLSLSALGNVISALSKDSPAASFVPYRDSKLTRFLQDALGGADTRTVMIATVSPSNENLEETISTLRYAHRAKSIKNIRRTKVVSNEPTTYDFVDEYAQASWMETVHELEKLNRFYESVIHTMIPVDVMKRLEATSFYNEVLGIWEIQSEASLYEPDSIDMDDEPSIVEETTPKRPSTVGKQIWQEAKSDRPSTALPVRQGMYPKARGLVTLSIT